MISKWLYINVIIRVSAIVLLSILMAYSFFGVHFLRFSVISIVMLTIVTVNLISYVNRTNRNIRFFFDSVKNDDTNLTFSVSSSRGSISELYESMNHVNHQIQQLKLDNRQQEQYFSKVLEHLATGIITYDKKGFIHHANSAAKRFLGTNVLTHIQQTERIDRKLYRTIVDLKPFERQLVAINTRQGDIQLSLKSTSFGTNENELMILSIQDIKHELDAKEVDSWMKLIRVLMHEIMNSITPITSLSESLSNIYRSGEKSVTAAQVTDKAINTTLQGLKVIKEQGKGLMEFVETFRKLTRIPKPEMKLFRVSDLFSRVKTLAGALEKGNRTQMKFYIDLPDLEIFADENLISLVLINLIKNAIEANANNASPVIAVNAGRDLMNRPEICVVDNGPGISPENLDEIFIPFFTTRENGSGIGLSISKQIMAAHGGTLKVRSVPERETVFCMSFQS